MSELPDDFERPFYTTVGLFVANWAFVEIALDHWITIIFRSAGGKHVEREMPRALSRKLKFLRRCTRQIDALAPYSKQALRYMTRPGELAKTRQFVVHGVLANFDADYMLISFVKIDTAPDKTEHIVSELIIPVQDLLNQGVECMNLASDMFDLAHRLGERFIPGYVPYEPPRRVGRKT